MRIVHTYRIQGGSARVGQDHGKGNDRNHICSGTLSSLTTRKNLLVATSRLLPILSPTSAVKWKEMGEPDPLFAIILFFLHFLNFLIFQNKVDEIRGETKF